MLVLGTALLAKHVVALPTPSPDVQLAQKLAPLRVPEDGDKWLAIHVLYAECRCSQRVVAALVATAKPPGFQELVLWAGNEPPPSALQGRFRIERVGSADLTRLGIDAAPLFIVLDPQGRVHYVGGYTGRKQGPELDYTRILSKARSADRVAALPVFGCAVSAQLRQRLSLFTGL